jgi:TPR repeat protein
MKIFAPIAVLVLSGTVLAQSGPAERARAAMQAGNYAEAYCVWRGLAESGDAEALYGLGWLYHNGYGLTIDDVAAVRWWEQAAAKNYPDALYALGNLYRFGGRAIPKDGPRAVGYYLRAAQAGDDEAGLLLRTLLARNDASVRERAAELLTQHAGALGGTLTVRVEKATLRKAPGSEAAALGVLTQGTALVELSRRSGWAQVGIPISGQIGWVKGSLVEPRP